MTRINAYLNFDGNCREAMNFYRDCLGGELQIQTVEGSPLEPECPSAMKEQVLHASLEKDNMILMGSDMQGFEGYIPGNSIALTLNCSPDEIKTFFSNLAEGGKIFQDITEVSWGASFGMLTDKYGIRWMLNSDKKQNSGL